MKKFIYFILLFLFVSKYPVYAAGVNGNAQISGMFDGSPIVIKTADRIAGAVDSLIWKGKEFNSGIDHGRSFQYAWFRSACDNPTEAGSANDARGPTSSSILQSITASGNKLTTVTNPAFWNQPGEKDPGQCPTGATNTTIVSNDVLKKTVTIGYGNLPNVIEFLADITFATQYQTAAMYPPTFYQPGHVFTAFWTYSLRDKKLQDVTNSLTPKPTDSSSDFSINIPTILSTADKTYAMGVYSPDISGENGGWRSYNLSKYPHPDDAEAVNINGAYFGRDVTPAGTYRYRTYVIIGNLNQVTTSLDQLYRLLPSNLYPLAGALDAADCTTIQGWSADQDNIDISNDVHIYANGPYGQGGTFMGKTTANTIREKGVCDAIGSTQSPCTRGYIFHTPDSLKDGKPHSIYAYGINLPNTPGTNILLPGSPKTITCKAIIPGDLNNDSIVNIDDLNIIIQDVGKTGSPGWIPADINKDGKVDIFDYTLLVGNYGR